MVNIFAGCQVCQLAGGTITFGYRQNRHHTGFYLFCIFPLCRMAYDPLHIELTGFMHQEFRYLFSGKQCPFLFIIALRIDVDFFTRPVIRQGLAHRLFLICNPAGRYSCFGCFYFFFGSLGFFRFIRQYIKTFEV